MQYFHHPQFNSVFFSIGPVSLHWYGMMYGLSFVFATWLLSYRARHSNDIFWTNKEIEHLLYLSFFGLLIGGRVGYVLFYQWSFLIDDCLWIFKFWQGGMSFHGGLIGVIISIKWFSYCRQQSFLKVSDFIVPTVPFGLGLGRLGNFINGELWGRVSIDTPWAMLFPNAIYQDIMELHTHPQWKLLFDEYGALPRHPSQLYEMFLEGILLFIIINIFVYKSHPVGSVSSIFLIFYGIFRIIIEFFRQPDSHLGLFMNNTITLGQILSFPMVIFGGIILIITNRQ